MLRRGDYVLCNFPFRESGGPGPSPHVVLCAATGRQGDANFAIVFYTASMNLPGFRFHALTGRDKGRYAVNASGNWRITFGWTEGDATDVDLEDYH